MVDSIKPNYRPIPSQGATRKQESSSGVESHSDDSYSIHVWNGQERRQQGERRHSGDDRNNSFDMRKGNGRRKDDGPHPKIEIKV